MPVGHLVAIWAQSGQHIVRLAWGPHLAKKNRLNAIAKLAGLEVLIHINQNGGPASLTGSHQC